MRYVEMDDPVPQAGEVVVKVDAIGVNFIDVYHRSGLYPLTPPYTPGSEAAGVVAAVGPGVDRFSPGDRVAFIHLGSYAEQVVVPFGKLVRVPDSIDSRTAAASLLQGVTGQYLTTSTYPLKEGDTILVQAAAGGAGSMLVQAAKQRGAYVFGTASTKKLDVAREASVDRVIDYTTEDFAEVVMRETEGRGVDVVYDSVGATTFDGGLSCLRPRGMMVLFGQSSGPVPPFDILRLMKKSLFLTRPTIANYIADPDELAWRAREVFEAIKRGSLRMRIERELPLRDAPEAHRMLEGRQTAGKLLLIP